MNPPRAAAATDPRRRPPRRTPRLALALTVVAAIVALAACGSSSDPGGSAGGTTSGTSGGTVAFTDAAGRVVQVPREINRVATVGFITGLDSFIYMANAQDKIVTGIPTAGFADFLKPYKVLAPRLLTLPTVQSSLTDTSFDKEKLIAVRPDVVLTADMGLADQIQKLGIPAVVIDDLNTGEALQHDVTLVGTLLGHEADAAKYQTYYNDIIQKVRTAGATVPEAKRPTTLYADFDPLTQPTPVEAWAFGVLGVHNVVPAGVGFHHPFSEEQLFSWNPDYIVVQLSKDLPQLTQSKRFATLTAVKDHHVAQIPSGLNVWGDNTVEEPLGLLWTAKLIYPSLFTDVDLAKETKSFYSTFFKVDLTDAQVTALLQNQGL